MGSEDYLTLPIQATSRADIGRLLREVEQIDNFLKQAAIREPGTSVKMPKTSRLLDEFVSSNDLNLLQDDDRKRVQKFLLMVKTKAPLLHMSFSVDPAPAFTQKLITWLRKEIHPLVLLQLGLQPNIGAGFVMRGTSKYYDFSLREHFRKQRPLLIDKLHGDMKKKSEEADAGAKPLASQTVPDNVPTSQSPEQTATEVEAAIAATGLPARSAPPIVSESQPAERVMR